MIELARRFLAPTKSAGALSATEFLDALEERFPLIGRLAQTPQDPVWHGEGNVRIHTEMVLDEIKPLALRRGDEEEQVVLVLGAALHDIGKTLTTAEDRTGERLRIVSPRHPAVGRNVVAPLLGQAGGKEGLTSRQRHQLLGLIGNHHSPKRLVSQSAPPRAMPV